MSSINTYTDIDLGLYEKEPITVIQKQGDNETRYIRARIIDNDGKEIQLSECMVTFSMVTSKNIGFIYSSRDINPRVYLDLVNNRIIVKLNENMLHDAGKADAEIIITDNDSTVSSTKFVIYVEPSVDQSGAESSPEYETLKSAIEEIKQITDLPYYANISKSYAIGDTGTRAGEGTDNSKYYYEESSKIKTTVEGYINQATNAAATATTKANEASSSATTASNKAEEASTYATNSSNKADESSSYATSSKSYAIGKTNTRSGEDTDNSKYYSEQSSSYSNTSKSYAIGGTGTRTGEGTDNSKYYSEQSSSYSTQSSSSAVLSKSYAIGGTNTRTGENTDNAKYYNEQCVDNVTLSKSWAVGDTGARSDEDNNNAKYWASLCINPYQYSYTEKKVGSWVNGKPLYEKTFHKEDINTYVSGTDNVRVDQVIYTNSCNIDELIFIDGKFDVYRTYTSPAKTVRRTYSILYASIGTDYQFNHTGLSTDDSSIYFGTTKQYSKTEYNFKDLYITIRYTKTTDSAEG